MKLTIEGKPKELKKLLNAIGSSKEQSKAVVLADEIKDFSPDPYDSLYQTRQDKAKSYPEVTR